MKAALKLLIGIVSIIILGVVAFLAAPLFYDKQVVEDVPVNEAMPVGTLPTTDADLASDSTPEDALAAAQSEVSVLAEGGFEGFDRLHQASGTARIIEVGGKRYVRFEENFTVTNGPDLFVHLGKDDEYDADANLGRLKGNIGSQNYEIPDSLDLDEYSEVWVWCRAFAVPFGKAELH